MSRKKRSKINFFKIIFVIIILILVTTLGIYYNYFYPRTKVKSITSNMSLDKNYLVNKFEPKNIKFSLNNINVQSDINFNEEELTDLFINIVNKTPELKQYLEGLSIKIEGENLKLYTHANYKKIPLEAVLTFTVASKEGNAFINYKEGKLGFISIPKEIIFSKLKNTPLLKFDKEKGNIIVSPGNIQGFKIYINNFSLKNHKLNVGFKGSKKLF
ncbi:hypothetical protein ACOAKC_06595 [Hathewaya histolytica]|uniref:hypothetical protein n=1 Tax=Hathewaya histolytica TaxID=1498 RepID=UPI003B67B32B